MPAFTDGHKFPKAVIFTHSFDEFMLFYGHFLNPIFLLVCVLLSLIICFRSEWDKWYIFVFILFSLLLFLEFYVRDTAVYGYVMFSV